MRRVRSLTSLFALAVLAAAGLATAGEKGTALAAQAAFDKLKALEGSWVASAEFAGDQTADHEIRVSAAGTVVMETMMAGTDHEMINMYHLDGDDLVLTHYCAGGNQPTMRLDLAKATATELPFVFTGGTNLPATDPHIHDAVLTLREDGSVLSHWTSYAGGEKGEELVFTLRRAEG
jgi:hypothetical protein